MDKIELYKGIDKDNQICQIKTIETIDDFMKVIVEFRKNPFYEILDKESCEKEFALYMEKGQALGYYKDGKIVGLNCLIYESDKSHSIKFDDDLKVAYYSGFVVLENFRNRGIGKRLIKETDNFLKEQNCFDYCYARVMAKDAESEPIFRLNDFEEVCIDGELVIDEVTYERNNPNVSQTDERKYMAKKLSDTKKKILRR